MGRKKHVWKKIHEVITLHKPTVIGIETLFAEKNVKTVMGIAEVIGIIRSCAYQYHIPLYTFTPLQIKSAITGNGRATKNEVEKMTRLLIQVPETKMKDDELDAIAVALTTSAYFKNITPVE